MKILVAPFQIFCYQLILFSFYSYCQHESHGVTVDDFHGMGANVYSVVDQLPLDDENRLLEHQLLYLDLPHCEAEFSVENLGVLAFRSIGKINGLLAFQYFGINITEDSPRSIPCKAVCLERGTHVDHILHPLPKHVNRDGLGINKWVVDKCQRAEFGFISYAPNPAIIYYITETGEEMNSGRLLQREKHTSWQQSYLGHKFRVRDEVTNEILGEYTVKFNAINVVGVSPPRLQAREGISELVQQRLLHEWSRSQRIKRTFTDVGFARGRLPPDLFSSMSSYYYNNIGNRIYEEWNSGGEVVNWWEANVYLTLMPWGLKKYWQSRLKILVEAWSGEQLELTDIYGMRRYEDGARLLTHVDREATHAASLIINIAQGAVRKPWKIEIYDFAGRLHEVDMSEGDIIYYESARCLHGRMQPLEGDHYVNLFAHYRPQGDPAWFEKANPEDSPEPLLDIGECSTDGQRVSCSKADEEQLPFLSPKMETVTGPHDLFSFWQETSPQASQSLHSEL